jgi:hypothetical protein
MPRAKAVKPARKKSTVLTKAVTPAKKEQVQEQRQILANQRALLRGLKADRVEASKAARAACKLEFAAAKAVDRHQKVIDKQVAKIEKLAT